MPKKLRTTLFFVLISCAFAQPHEHWVASWTTPQPMIRPQPPAPRPPAQTNPAAPARQPGPDRAGFHNQTVRMIVRTGIGGSQLRITLASPFGGQTVSVGSAHVAVRGKDSEIEPGTDHAITFNGKPGCIVEGGQVILSDPVAMTVPAQTDLAVSLYFPGETGPASAHNGLHTAYVSREGDLTGASSIPDAISVPSYYWLESVDVLGGSKAAAIVAFGDSITEGARSTPNTNSMWPAVLSARLAANKKTADLAVVDMGIGGNRVLRDGSGASALARFDRDVIGQAGVKWVMLLEGINDIGHGDRDPVTADNLIGAFRQLIERAHTHGIGVVGCTLTPYEGAGYSRPEGEAIREALNQWIRTSGAFDAVVDFEAATKDPNNPKRIRADFDPGDHLHPNDAGYHAMGEAVDLSIFTSAPRHLK